MWDIESSTISVEIELKYKFARKICKTLKVDTNLADKGMREIRIHTSFVTSYFRIYAW